MTEKLGQTNFDDSPAWGAPEDEVLLTSSELEAEISELKQKIQKIVTTTTDMDPMKEPVKLWPNGRVPYVISEELDSNAREKINEAIEEFHQKTCVNFEPRLKSDQDYVHFVPHQNMCGTKVGNIGLDSYAREKINEAIEEFKQKTCVNFEPRLKSDRDYVFFDKIPNGCTSPLGKDWDGGVQYIYLTPDCQRNKPDIQHEMMHTLGNVYVVMSQRRIGTDSQLATCGS